ncbi:MAG: histidinol-phosphatase HisJ [Bacilli bacterium]
MNWDGHVHTPYCPHGSEDAIEAYIEKAIQSGIKTLSFTEHAPLPERFIDPSPQSDSAMAFTDLEDYLLSMRHFKYHYQDQIDIRIGLEVDYIEGFEMEIETFLEEYGPELDDSILSVHFLKHKDTYHCLDYSSSMFRMIVEEYGSLPAVYADYWRTLEKSIEANLGFYKPTRIGHPTLVTKFQKKFPIDFSIAPAVERICERMQQHNLAFDLNTSGLRKKHCGIMYPDEQLLPIFAKYEIPFVAGSDAHIADDIAYEFNTVKKLEKKYGLIQHRK